MLRIDINLLFTVINLLVIFFVIWKFLFKPVKKIIAKRQEEVESEYDKAKEAMDKADEARNKYDEALRGAESEKEGIIRESRANAGAEYDRIVKEARKEAERIVDDAKKEAEEERERVRIKTNDEIALLAAKAAEKIAHTKSDPTADRQLFDEFLTKSEQGN